MTAGVPEEQRHPAPEPDRQRAAHRRLGMFPANSARRSHAAASVDADIDRAAARVLGQIERFGWLDHPPRHAAGAAEHRGRTRASSSALAERGAVLLKNDGVLPLRSADLDSLALIGPGALQTFAIVDGRGAVLRPRGAPDGSLACAQDHDEEQWARGRRR